MRPRELRPSFVAPSALLAFLVALPVLLALVGPVALLPLAGYLGAVGLSATWIAGTLRALWAVPVAAALTVLLHLWYGAGVVRGAVAPRGPGSPALEWREQTVAHELNATAS